ncbi:HipA domain-containing protein [Rhizosphaericola mali]|uniref:HipA domain-containing protein n=1 Tax=Rhizosphaericola mali TaxID=2545455 RepID=A0A5P2G7N3_9BACT|nr:HipA domain-containing protein [Rhizosphaericola mali]QES90289.1 HipA domain-containing protein [Rhizosphaericola mali]
MEIISVCPATLRPGHDTYSTTALRHLFNGRKVSHILPFAQNESNGEQRKLSIKDRARISISGVQEKYSLRLEKNILTVTQENGQYILKPMPTELDNVEFVPANEHLTMQIASQIYKIETAQNALIFFPDEAPAYITKRFDVVADGVRCLKEDFASLMLKTSDDGNKNFKYDGSYLQMAETIDKFLPAALIAKENLFKLVVFNYLFSNGDAHLKNYSVVDYEQNGLYQLAPAYDLICTRLHIEDGDFALEDRLYDGDFDHPSFAYFGFHAYDDFYDFGIKIGLLPLRVKKIMDNFLSHVEEVIFLTQLSFLSESLKEIYIGLYKEKLKRLSLSLKNSKQ